MRRVFIGLFLLLALAPPKKVVSGLTHFYELCYRICCYDIEEFCSPAYERSEKTLCLKEYATEEMRSFLEGDDRERKFLSSHTGKISEKVEIDGKLFIVKTQINKGFWPQLFVRGRGIGIWNNAHRAKRRGLAVLKPIALRWDSSISQIVYLMEGVEGKETKEHLGAIEKLVQKMIELRILMRDLQLANVVFPKDDAPQLIDIGRLFEYPKYSLLFPRALHGQLQRFNEEKPLIYEHKLFPWAFLMRELSHLYQRAWPLFHYDYAAIANSNYIKKLSFCEKMLCHKDYYTKAMEKFLQGEDRQERGLMSIHEGYITERIELDGKAFIVKTTERKGFFGNILEMTIGVKVWNNGHLAKELGLPALTPIALLEKRTLQTSRSLVIYPMEGTILRDAMEKRGDLAPAISEIVKRMQELHAIHAEFRPLNALYLEEGHVQLVDIDGLHTYPSRSYLFKKRLEIEVDRFNRKAKQSGLSRYHLK